MTPRRAWALAFGVLALLVGGRMLLHVAHASDHPDRTMTDSAVAVAAHALFGLLLVPIMRGSASRVGQRWSLVGLAVLTAVPYLFVAQWQTPGGFLAAGCLLVLRTPTSWWLCATVVATDALLSTWTLSDSLSVWTYVGLLSADVNAAVTVFAVTRLAQLVEHEHAARNDLAALRVKAERLTTARALRESIGRRLAGIVVRVRTIRNLPDAGRTRIGIAEIGELARLGAADARTITGAERPSPHSDDPPGEDTTDAGVAHRLAWRIHATLIVAYTVLALSNIRFLDLSFGEAWLPLAIVAALQLHHGAPRRHDTTPWGWPYTFVVHGLAVVSLVGFVSFWAAIPGVLAVGVMLIWLRWPWSLALVVAAAIAFAVSPDGYTELTTDIYVFASVIVGAVVVYALFRLPEVTRELHETRALTAELAVRAERRRLARDLHDTLGFHLSAIVLKAELAAADVRRAGPYLAEIDRLAGRALAEVRALTEQPTRLRLDDEVEQARSLLTAAGIEPSTDLVDTDLPPAVDHLLAVVLREATTNVVRHSTATRCSITLTFGVTHANLRVSNDGPDTRAPRRPGTGLANLAQRVSDARGTLTATLIGAEYVLAARVPMRPTADIPPTEPTPTAAAALRHSAPVRS